MLLALLLLLLLLIAFAASVSSDIWNRDYNI